MNNLTISQVSKALGVSTRTLRYYEEVGLIESIKKEDYAYRTYNEDTIRRMQQIIVLRKLRIKLNDIAQILKNDNVSHIIEIFLQSLNEVNEEISALTSIKLAYEEFIQLLKGEEKADVINAIPDLDVFVESIEKLPITKNKLREEKTNMNVEQASNTISKLKDTDVRFLYLPAFTVASAHYIGNNPEDVSGKMIDDFVKEYNLMGIKPDLRLFGFNNPSPTSANEVYGYEFWITIPEDLKVMEPYIKKHFTGGLYAAYCINMGEFEGWRYLNEFIESHKEYEREFREPLGMYGSLEEHLNAPTYFNDNTGNASFKQVDLLMPVKLK